MNTQALVSEYRVRFVRKSDSRLMRAIGIFLFRVTPKFMSSFVTTLGQTIYLPSKIVDLFQEAYEGLLAHELVHVRQWLRFGPLMWAIWCIGVPRRHWGLWYIERTAFLEQINRGASVWWAVDKLWDSYGKPWPRSAMGRWFNENVGRESMLTDARPTLRRTRNWVPLFVLAQIALVVAKLVGPLEPLAINYVVDWPWMFILAPGFGGAFLMGILLATKAIEW